MSGFASLDRAAPSAAALALLLAGCVGGQVRDETVWRSAQVRSILVVPPVNKSIDLDAAEFFLSTLPVPLAERGYYVFPVNLVKRVLEDDGLADASLVHGADPARLCALFGADAVLYSTVEAWTATYLVVSTSVRVDVDYKIKDCKTGAVIWRTWQGNTYTPNNQGQGLLGALVSAAITKASPNDLPLARRANAEALAYPGPGFPAGPYLPLQDSRR